MLRVKCMALRVGWRSGEGERYANNDLEALEWNYAKAWYALKIANVESHYSVVEFEGSCRDQRIGYREGVSKTPLFTADSACDPSRLLCKGQWWTGSKDIADKSTPQIGFLHRPSPINPFD